MLSMILPKSSARAWPGRTAKTRLAATIAARRVPLVVVIGVLQIGLGLVVLIFVLILVPRRSSVIVFVFSFVMAFFIGNSQVTLEQAELVDVNVAYDVHDRELARLRHQDGQAGDAVALLHNVDLVMLVGTLATALDDPAPARPGQLRADGIHVRLRVLIRFVELEVLDVDSLQVLQNLLELSGFGIMVGLDELPGQL